MTMKRLLSVAVMLLTAVVLFAHNDSFDLKYQQAYSLYKEGKYERSLVAINSALKNLPNLSDEQKAKGKNLISLCNQAIAFRDRLYVSRDNLSFSCGSYADSVTFDAGRPDLVTISSDAEWCKAIRSAENTIRVTTDYNMAKEARNAVVTVKMGNIKSTKISVKQAERGDTRKRVILRTIPDKAAVRLVDKEPIIGTWDDTLASGPRTFRIEKDGYYPKDTTILIEDDMLMDDVVEVSVALAPKFAKAFISVLPEDGFRFDDNSYSLTVNGIQVSNVSWEPYSYDDDRAIQRYVLYQDGSIPLSAGPVTIVAAAKNFVAQKDTIRFSAGEVKHLTYTLQAVTGFLSVSDHGQAREARVLLDGKDIGTVENIFKRRIGVGEHSIAFERNGYTTQENSYPVTIVENQETSVNVSMVRYARYSFETEPSEAKVYIDGVYVGDTPTKPQKLLEKADGAPFTVNIAKDGYLAEHFELNPEFTSQEIIQKRVDLVCTSLFEVETDIPYIDFVIKNKKDGDTTFVSGTTPVSVGLPLRKSPYYIEMHRPGQKRIAYRNTFKFNDPSKNKRHFQTYSHYDFQILSGNLFLTDASGFAANDKQYRNVGNLSFLKYKICPGLSTAIVRANLFMAADNSVPFSYSKDGKDYDVTTSNINYVPALSLMLLNGEFRIGGALFDYMDANLLASYAWYPDLPKKLAYFSHIVGHDIFVGGEVTSRIPRFNINLKAGLQMYPGLKANIYNPDQIVPYGSTKPAEKYFTVDMDYPDYMFVFGIGFSLGTKDAKGNNLLRVF